MRLLAIETPSGLLFKGGHADVVSKLTDFEINDNGRFVPEIRGH